MNAVGSKWLIKRGRLDDAVMTNLFTWSVTIWTGVMTLLGVRTSEAMLYLAVVFYKILKHHIFKNNIFLANNFKLIF